jgi:hypothetical protein
MSLILISNFFKLSSCEVQKITDGKVTEEKRSWDMLHIILFTIIKPSVKKSGLFIFTFLTEKLNKEHSY